MDNRENDRNLQAVSSPSVGSTNNVETVPQQKPNDMEEIRQNAHDLRPDPINPDRRWIGAENDPDIESKVLDGLDSLKEEVASEIGLLDEIEKVGGDTGMLSPNTFGMLGGGMTSRLVEFGKRQYMENKKKGQ